MKDIGAFLMRCLTTPVYSEIKRIVCSRASDLSDLSEIRLRSCGISNMTLGGERIQLRYKPTCLDLQRTLSLALGGAVYTASSSIIEGYVTTAEGVRVGVVGKMSLNGEPSLDAISSLVFRIPTKRCELVNDIFAEFVKCKSGLIIYSQPGCGKTTALADLAVFISSGRTGLDVAYVDTACEFSASTEGCFVDIYRGYPKGRGMKMALRTCAPSVIMVDELCDSDEVEGVLMAARSGVRVVATAHAGSIDDLYSRVLLKPLFVSGVFDIAVGIRISEGGRSLVSDRIHF